MEHPATDYFTAYADYAKGPNEVPEVFHDACAYAFLSAAVGARAWLDFGFYRVRCNTAMVLTGPPATAKSTAINIGKQCADRAGGMNFAADTSSLRAVLDDIMAVRRPDDTHGTIDQPVLVHESYTFALSEIVTFIKEDEPDIHKFLCKTLDCEPYRYRTAHQGSPDLENPCITFIGGCTPSDVPQIFGEQAVGSGLVSRLLFVYADKPARRVSFPSILAKQQEAREVVIDWLRWAQAAIRIIQWSPEAREAYDSWYQACERDSTDPRLSGFYGRRHIQLLKLSALQAIGHGEYVLRPEHLAAAQSFLDALTPGIKRALSVVGGNKAFRIGESVYSLLIQRGGPVPYAELLREHMLFAGKRELDQVLETLMAAGRIRIDPSCQSPTGQLAQGSRLSYSAVK